MKKMFLIGLLGLLTLTVKAQFGTQTLYIQSHCYPVTIDVFVSNDATTSGPIGCAYAGTIAQGVWQTYTIYNATTLTNYGPYPMGAYYGCTALPNPGSPGGNFVYVAVRVQSTCNGLTGIAGNTGAGFASSNTFCYSAPCGSLGNISWTDCGYGTLAHVTIW